MMRQKAKQQHFVPQQSLRRFSAEPSAIWVFDKSTGKSFKNSIDKTACQKYFYDLKTFDHDETRPEDFQIAERAFCEIEALGQPIVDEVCQAAGVFGKAKSSRKWSDKLIYKNNKEKLAYFLAVQYFRTPEMRSTFTNFSRVLLKLQTNSEVKEAGLNPLDFDVRLSRECIVGEHVLWTFLLSDEVHQALARHIWLVGVLPESKFVASDTPVALVSHSSTELKSGAGLLAPGIEIVWNLSPLVNITLADREQFAPMQKIDGRCARIPLACADYTNSLQLRNCQRYLYGPRDDFDWARDLLATNPSWKEPAKQIIEVGASDSHGISQLFNPSYKPEYVLFQGRPEHADEID